MALNTLIYVLLNLVLLAPHAGVDVWITNEGQRTTSELLRAEISEVEAYEDELAAMIWQEVRLPLPVSRFPHTLHVPSGDNFF